MRAMTSGATGRPAVVAIGEAAAMPPTMDAALACLDVARAGGLGEVRRSS
jgi:hypothetical protein